MSSFLIAAIAIFLDRLLGEPTAYSPLHSFTRMATFIEQLWHGPEELITIKKDQPNQAVSTIVKIKGLLAMLFLVLPVLALVLFLRSLGQFNFLFDILFLYLSIGAQNLKQQALDVQNAIAQNNIEEAQKKSKLTDQPRYR